jgi:hypothetical protein
MSSNPYDPNPTFTAKKSMEHTVAERFKQISIQLLHARHAQYTPQSTLLLRTAAISTPMTMSRQSGHTPSPSPTLSQPSRCRPVCSSTCKQILNTNIPRAPRVRQTVVTMRAIWYNTCCQSCRRAACITPRASCSICPMQTAQPKNTHAI